MHAGDGRRVVKLQKTCQNPTGLTSACFNVMPRAGVKQLPSLTTYLAEDPFALPPNTEYCRHALLFPIILLHFGGKGLLVSILSNLSHLVTFGVLWPSLTLGFLGQLRPLLCHLVLMTTFIASTLIFV